jgi:uncharacterized repeat protein (TIGR03803 family)
MFLSVFVLGLIAGARAEARGYKVLHGFTAGKDGGGVYGNVIQDRDGNLYGTTTGGGEYNAGVVFELALSSGGKWGEAVLHSFCSQPHCADGGGSVNGLTVDATGKLYGAAGGGPNNSGVAFELTRESESPAGWTYTVIYNSGSSGSLVMDNAGDLYGEWGPGKYGKGDVFELMPGVGGWTEKVLYSFCPHLPNCNDGVLPGYGLTWDAAGNLYGVTTAGGVNKAGVAFKLERIAGGWKEHVLHSFPASPSDGYNFFAGLALDRSGNVYGTTLQGGRIGAGTVFELSPQQDGHWKETILYDFPNASHDGGGPAAGLVIDQSGNLYGTTTGGGDSQCSCGVVFKMTPGSNGKWSYTVLHRFTGTDGYSPQASLTLDSKGNIYGTTTEGGPGGYGVVFEITP